MESEKKTAAAAAGATGAKTVNKVKSLPVTITVTQESFTDDNRQERDFFKMVISNPWPDEPLDELRVTFVKPNKTDTKGRPAADIAGQKAKGLFEYGAKKALAGKESLEFRGTVTYRQFKNVPYISIEVVNPFPFGDEDAKSLRLHMKKPEVQAVFDMLAKQSLELTLDNA